jgi:hypothetical protein
VDLRPDKVSNVEMGYIYEELIRKFSELSNETAGEHFTPREVIRLMVDLLFIEDDDALRARRRTDGLAFGRMDGRLPMDHRSARQPPTKAGPTEPQRRDRRERQIHARRPASSSGAWEQAVRSRHPVSRGCPSSTLVTQTTRSA